MRDAFGVARSGVSKMKVPKPPKPMGKKSLKYLKKAGVDDASLRRMGKQPKPEADQWQVNRDQEDFDNWMTNPNSKLSLNPNPPKSPKNKK